jgi:hypothetical protein
MGPAIAEILEIEPMSASLAKIVQYCFLRDLQFFSLQVPIERIPQAIFLDSPLGYPR